MMVDLLFSMPLIIGGIALYAWYALTLGRILGKAGRSPGVAWVPFANEAAFFRLVGWSAWPVLGLLVPALALIGAVALALTTAMSSGDLSALASMMGFAALAEVVSNVLLAVYGVTVLVARVKANTRFGQSGGMAVLGILLWPVWMGILAFGSPRWQGEEPYVALPTSAHPTALPSPTPTGLTHPRPALDDLTPLPGLGRRRSASPQVASRLRPSPRDVVLDVVSVVLALASLALWLSPSLLESYRTVATIGCLLTAASLATHHLLPTRADVVPRSALVRFLMNAPTLVVALVVVAREMLIGGGLVGDGGLSATVNAAVALGLAGAILAAGPRDAELDAAGDDARRLSRSSAALGMGVAALIGAIGLATAAALMRFPGSWSAYATLVAVVVTALPAVLMLAGVVAGGAWRWLGIGLGLTGAAWIGLAALGVTADITGSNAHWSELTAMLTPALGAAAALPLPSREWPAPGTAAERRTVATAAFGAAAGGAALLALTTTVATIAATGDVGLAVTGWVALTGACFVAALLVRDGIDGTRRNGLVASAVTTAVGLALVATTDHGLLAVVTAIGLPLLAGAVLAIPEHVARRETTSAEDGRSLEHSPAPHPAPRGLAVGIAATTALLLVAGGAAAAAPALRAESTELAVADGPYAPSGVPDPAGPTPVVAAEGMPASDPVTVDYTHEPRPAWTVDSGALGSGAVYAAEANPLGTAYTASVVLAVAVETGFYGLDAHTGTIVWFEPNQDARWCQVLDDGRHHACVVNVSDDDSRIEVIETSTGRLIGSVTPDYWAIRMIAIGDDLVVAGYRCDDDLACSVVMSRRTLASPYPLWERVGTTLSVAYPSYLWDEAVQLRDGVISYAINGGLLAVDAGTGEVVHDVAYGTVGRQLPNGDAALSAGEWGAQTTSVVEAGSGRAALEADGSTWDVVDVPGASRDVVGVGDTVYSLSTRSPRWQLPSDRRGIGMSGGTDISGYDASATVVGDVVVYNASQAVMGEATGYDLRTGEQLWEADLVFGGVWHPLGDGVLVTQGCVDLATAFDPSDGTQWWTVPDEITDDPWCEDGYRESFLLAGDMLLDGRASSLSAYRFPTAGESAAPIYVTKCGQTPQFEPVAAVQRDGRLAVTLHVTTRCPNGDFLASAGTTITISDGAGTVASGVFDMSRSPVLVSGDGDPTEVTLSFPVGSFWRVPDDVDVRTILVQCREDPSSAPPPGASPPDGTTWSADQATASVNPSAAVDSEDLAWEALRRQADEDRAQVLDRLDGHWVAQLSSKKPGLVADGRVWDNQATYAEFLRLRLAYPDAVLTYSGDWSTYTYKDFWVTSLGRPFDTPEEANGWCEDQGFDPDHCFAKLISSTHGTEGSTRNR